MCVGQTKASELVAGPFTGDFHFFRPGRPRADSVGKIVQMIHYSIVLLAERNDALLDAALVFDSRFRRLDEDQSNTESHQQNQSDKNSLQSGHCNTSIPLVILS